MAAVMGLASVQARQAPSFRSRAVAVRVDVLVTDDGRPVEGLSATDFALRDNGVPQSVQLLEAAEVPLNVVLALDVSASTTGRRHTELVAATQALLERLGPSDRAALTVFSHVVTPVVALTANVQRLRQALARTVPSGRTAVLDATYVALTETVDEPGRSLVVVYTDGADVSSWLQRDDVIETARRSNAVLYVVAPADTSTLSGVEDVAAATGGDTLHLSSIQDVRSTFQRILEEFRRRYVLAYTPTGVPSAGFHTIEVRVKRRGVRVKARPGYVGIEASK